MITRMILPILGILGLLGAVIFTQSYGRAQAPEINQLSTPPATPYNNTVSGTGIVEANTRNIQVGSHMSGIVAEVLVKEGDVVQAGAPLFKLDDRAALADKQLAEQEVNAAEARLNVAQATLADEKDQLQRIEKLKAGTSVSVDRQQRQRFATKRASATLNQTKAELESAKAKLQQAQVTLERLTVTAPVAGRILKTSINTGEFISAASQNQALILMGNDSPLYLRVSVDENDVWRFTKDASAKASLRSNKDINFPLTFVRVEPYVQPKQNLSGNSMERVDTRVLEVIYSFDAGDKPVFIGQQMDVFIEAQE